MLKNPMILMMLFMGGMAFVMPKMMEGLDQEQLEEMRGKVCVVVVYLGAVSECAMNSLGHRI